MNIKIQYKNTNSILIINSLGTLRQLFTPFGVECIHPIGNICKKSVVFVEQVIPHNEHKIIYLIMGSWYPYGVFKIRMS